MLKYLPSHNLFKMHERPVLNQFKPVKTETGLKPV